MRWSCTPDLKLACSDKKNKQMHRRDNHLLQPGDADSYPEDNDDVCISQAANAQMS